MVREAVVAALAGALLAAAGAAPAALAVAKRAPAPKLRLRVLSSRADLVSGGDALIRVDGARRARVKAGRRDVTAAFARRASASFAGLVRGLPVGRTRLTARAGRARARLTIVNHPLSGPVLAGPQTQPWICATAENGLGPPADAACSVQTRYRYVYRSNDPGKVGFQDYDPEHPPADVATTTTDEGREVPFVVRVETGVIDRGIYTVAVLYDLARPWAPWAPQPQWNRKVLWMFGGDCKPYHRQDPPVDPLGGPAPATVDDGDGAVGASEAIGSIYGNGNAVVALERGFAVANSALNKLGSQCNSVVSAEALAMVKEHMIETYGPIRYTIGAGSSGGSMQQHQIAAGYPGLLDGIQPMGSFPDVWETLQEAEDCHLLNHYFDTVSPQLWAVPAQRDAVMGWLEDAGCRLMLDGPHGAGTPLVGNYAGMWLDPANAPGCGLPAEQVYDAAANRAGVRCTLPDYMASIFGRRASDGFANTIYDNTGVQYGLQALRSGTISAEQFVDLNEKVGGLDVDWRYTPARSIADAPAVSAAYRGALVSDGPALARVAIVDLRGTDNFEIHSSFHSYVMRARLDRSAGGHANQAIWTGARPLLSDPTSFNRAFLMLDDWLARVEADHRPGSRAAKIVRDKPAEAVDTCWIEGRPVTDRATCDAAFPHLADPRIAAGGPETDDVLACALKPLDRRDYPGSSADQWARLQHAFGAGVCDYARPPAAYRAPETWVSYG